MGPYPQKLIKDEWDDIFMIVSGFQDTKSRKVMNISQSKDILIDIDCEKVGMSKEDAISEVKRRVDDSTIPVPSVITASNGVQLWYSIDDEVAMTLDKTKIYKSIVESLSASLFELGVDSKVSNSSQLTRLSELNDMREGTNIDVIEVGTSYKLLELHGLVEKSLDKESPSQKFGGETPFYKLASDRVSDLEILWQLRGRQNRKVEGYQNEFTYIYAFYQSFFESESIKVQERTQWIFKRAGITPEIGFGRTVRQAFNDCTRFHKSFVDNKFVMTYAQDGIIRPHKSETIVKLLNISAREELKLESLVSETAKYERKKIREANRIFQKRRNEGIASRQAMEKARYRGRLKLRLKALEMLGQGMSKTAVAAELKVSRPTLYKILSSK